MSAALLNITIRQGEDLTIPFTWATVPLDGNQNPLLAQAQANDLTNYTSKATILDSSGLVRTPLYSSGSGIVLGGAAGTLTWTITSTQSKLWTAGRGLYDLWVISPGGLHYCLLQGTFIVEAAATAF